MQCYIHKNTLLHTVLSAIFAVRVEHLFNNETHQPATLSYARIAGETRMATPFDPPLVLILQ